jgi:hypothetical protein
MRQYVLNTLTCVTFCDTGTVIPPHTSFDVDYANSRSFLYSSVGNDILGFDSAGRVVNKPDHGNLDWVRVCEQSSKVITFIDLAGHEKYLKTTVFGMTGHAPGNGKKLCRFEKCKDFVLFCLMSQI